MKTVLRGMVALAISCLLCSCGPEKEEPTLQELTAAAEEALGMDPGSGAGWLEFGGVGYELHAKAAPRADGKAYGVDVKVVADATDDAEHGFVHDEMEPADTGPIALWFAGSVTQPNGDSASFSESTLTINKDLRVVKQGQPATFERSYPDPVHATFKNENDPGPAVAPGGKLVLEVGLLGLETPKGGTRAAPKLFTVELSVSVDGKPSLNLEPSKPKLPAAAPAAEGEIAGHAVTIRPYSSQDGVFTGTSDRGIASLSVGQTKVRVREGHLLVGFRYFGTLPEGAPIDVDGEQVKVAGEERSGRDLPTAELMKLFPFDATVKELAGRSVRVIPAGGSAVMRFGEQQMLTVGETKVEIESGSLKVDDKPYGKLAPKAKVEVKFGEVSVNGKQRAPTGQ